MSLFYYYIPFITLFELSHCCTNYMTNRIAIEIKKYTAEKSLIFQGYGRSINSSIQSLKWKSTHYGQCYIFHGSSTLNWGFLYAPFLEIHIFN